MTVILTNVQCEASLLLLPLGLCLDLHMNQ